VGERQRTHRRSARRRSPSDRNHHHMRQARARTSKTPSFIPPEE
jgi:hypothetical protein